MVKIKVFCQLFLPFCMICRPAMDFQLTVATVFRTTYYPKSFSRCRLPNRFSGSSTSEKQ